MKTFFLLFFMASCSFARAGFQPGLIAVYDNQRNSVKLKWQHQPGTSRYVLQRSTDNSGWADIYTRLMSQPGSNDYLQYLDNKVTPGKNYYRLKTYSENGVETGRSLLVIIGAPGNSWLMYPVPVRDLLNLQYNGNVLITGVITVTIQSVSSGLMFHKLRFASTNRLLQIPVSNLGRGIYDVRIYVSDKVVWNQRFAK
jgi:hypothetical protein